MFQKKRILSLIIALFMVLPLFILMGNRAEANSFNPDNFYVDRDSIRFIQGNSPKINHRLYSNEDLHAYANPETFSVKAKYTWMWFRLRGADYKDVTGIKVSKIEIIQNGRVVARANNVESRSISGQYITDNLEFINSFENQNGKNSVDIVFYLGSKEVARVRDFKLGVYTDPVVIRIYPKATGVQRKEMPIEVEIINVQKDDSVEIYLIDEMGKVISKKDKEVFDYYDDWNYKRTLSYGISFLSDNYVKANNDYKVVVTVNGRKILNLDNDGIWLSDDSLITASFYPRMPNLYYEVTGINLVNNNPYRLIIKQNEEVTGEIENISAQFDQLTYEETIYVPLTSDYFSVYGEMYNTELYNKDGDLIHESRFLEPIDDISDIIDEVDPFEGYEVFEKKENVEPDKTWWVEFNKPLDLESIDKSSIYIIEKSSGLSIDVNYELETNGKVIALTPIGDIFELGKSYYLVIEDRVQSYNGVKLYKPVVLEFTIRY